MDMTIESWVPIDRLTAEDINEQPGGLVAVIIIVLIIAVCALVQLWTIRKMGWLVFYLKWYAVGGILLGILAALPSLELRMCVSCLLTPSVFTALAHPTCFCSRTVTSMLH